MDILIKHKTLNVFKAQKGLKMVKYFRSYNQWITETKPKTDLRPQLRPELSAKWIRKSFIDYFIERHNHLRVNSSPVIPLNDDSLLFVSAGMNQFKQLFQNRLPPTDPKSGYKRAVNSQKCIRVGGKHCDLNAVGTDGRHHTFFEMLGNWSFGDYYKTESCGMAWDLLTNVFKLDPNRLVITYFGGDKHLALEPDLETKDIWLKIGVPKHRVIPMGANDNFWEMGDTGPCGLCTEIHYLLEPTMSLNGKEIMNNCIEIWNIVFIQFDKQSNGELNGLHKHFVDTGMGLERITSVVQNVKSNYETDLFLPYFHSIQKIAHCRPYSNSAVDSTDISYRILADHSRMFTIAISDGLRPSYRGTGFILRKIIRKSIGIASNDFGISSPRQLFAELSAITTELLGEAFPEVQQNLITVVEVIDEEIEKYESVIKDNKRLVKAFNDIDIKYSIHLNQEIVDKLQKISFDFDIKCKDYSIDKQFLDSNKRYLIGIKDILSDYTINLRHNLPKELNEKIDNMFEKLENFEKHLISLFSNEFQTIVGKDCSKYFVHNITTTGDSSFAFKTGLDFLGHKPTALFHVSPNGQEFYVQTTVPNEYQKYLKANEWLTYISKQVNGFEMLSKKRSHKMSSFKTKSIDRLEDAISCAERVAKDCFK